MNGWTGYDSNQDKDLCLPLDEQTVELAHLVKLLEYRKDLAEYAYAKQAEVEELRAYLAQLEAEVETTWNKAVDTSLKIRAEYTRMHMDGVDDHKMREVIANYNRQAVPIPV